MGRIYEMDNYKINIIKSIINSEFASIGVGTGFRWYHEYNPIDFEHSLIGDPNQIPFFLDIRTTFKKQKLVPFGAIKIGSSFQYWGDWHLHNEGFLLGLFAGFRIRIFEKHAIITGISYDSQKMLIWADATKFSEVNTHITSKSLGINFGISF